MRTMTARPCPQRIALLGIYQQAVLDYSAAARLTSQNIGTCALDKYKQYHEVEEAARTRALEARLELEQHTQRHGCVPTVI